MLGYGLDFRVQVVAAYRQRSKLFHRRQKQRNTTWGKLMQIERDTLGDTRYT